MISKRFSELKKIASQTDGILSQEPINIDTRTIQRQNKNKNQYDGLYDLQFEKEDYTLPDEYKKPTHLSTRYVPGLAGVSAERVPNSANVFKDPHSGKVFDYNEGFEQDGVVYQPQGAQYQTSVMYSYAKQVSKDLKRKAS